MPRPLGRDLFIRLLYGARISLFVGVVTTAIGTVLLFGVFLQLNKHGVTLIQDGSA